MTFATANPTSPVEVVLSVDTHLDFHVAVVLDQLGRKLGALTVPTTERGYESLLEWARRLGPVGRAGLEGTGSYGAGLAHYLRTQGVQVLEVERPRRRSRHKGKSDPSTPRTGRRVPSKAPLACTKAGQADPSAARNHCPGYSQHQAPLLRPATRALPRRARPKR